MWRTKEDRARLRPVERLAVSRTLEVGRSHEPGATARGRPQSGMTFVTPNSVSARSIYTALLTKVGGPRAHKEKP